MDGILQDLRQALRGLARNKGFTAAALVSLALGIGANTALFSVVYGVLLRPLPYRDSGRIVRLSEHHPGAQAAIRGLVAAGLPVFGICLGHQLLCLALGARTFKMKFGHHGANHPVRELATGKVFITSQNHGFAADPETLPPTLRATHVSLFDGSLQGVELAGRPVFSLQGHPEASPGPRELAGLFDRFAREVTAGRALLIVEHDLSLILRLCDRIVVLNKGEIIAAGSPEAIQNDPAVIEAYIGTKRSRRMATQTVQ